MQGNRRLLLGLAAGNIRKNGSTYLPYMGISTFAVFTYFVFDLILKNDLIYTLPRGNYATMMIYIGFYLLGIILVPFLYYTNSFLIKRRKRELGLYSILGMEKKHIGIMMFWESVVLYGIVEAAAIILGLLFSRLLFLLLLNMTNMPVDVGFMVNPRAVLDTLLFFGFVTLLNLIVNLVQVGKANPVELMSEARGGEKQPRFLFLWSLLGVLALGYGYRLALTMRFNSGIFNSFFIAVLVVVIGTYFLFTSGSIVYLQFLKRRKRLYYQPDNFITVSGMLYRMKKSAAGLSNICIFSTMAIITVVCTAAVWLGMDSIREHMYDKDFEILFLGRNTVDREALKGYIAELAAENQVEIAGLTDYSYVKATSWVSQGNFFEEQNYVGDSYYEDVYGVMLTTLEEYNRLEGKAETLERDQVILYSTGADADWETISFGEREFSVKEELLWSSIWQKSQGNYLDPVYVVVTATEEELAYMAQTLGVEAAGSWIYRCGFDPAGEETGLNAFSVQLYQHVAGMEGYAGYEDHRSHVADMESSYGGLLFVGVFYGLIFLICLVVTMYYKQMTEGFEDRKNFEIMQKIGMSDEEIRRTIKKQIRMVFLLPLAGALLHTAVGMRLVYVLLGVIGYYENILLLGCTLGVSLVFAVAYILCYQRTSQAYYRIVRLM